MPFNDPEKERAWRRKYWAERPEQRTAKARRYYYKHREKRLAYAKEYNARPEVKEKRKQDYLEHRTEKLAANKLNRMMKKYETKQNIRRHRKSCRDYMRRKRNGISIRRTENGYFWKAGIISNGPFDYRKDAIKDAELAFL